MYVENIISIWLSHLSEFKEVASSSYLIGAATFTENFLTNPKKFIYTYWLQSCVRHDDRVEGFETYRSAQHTQFQVILPTYYNPYIFVKRLLLSIGLQEKYIKLVPDNWKNPTIGSFGVGWEVHYKGIEIAQITYFSKALNKNINGVLEIVFGLERISMILSGSNKYYMAWKDHKRNLDNYFINRAMLRLQVRHIRQLLKVFNSFKKKGFTIIRLYTLSLIYNHLTTKYHLSGIIKAELIKSISEFIPSD